MDNNSQLETWEVFIQARPGGAYAHAGSVHASDGRMALQNARDTFTRRSEGSSLWVVPTEAIIASNPEDNDMFFDPANDKIYRLPTFYVMPDGAKAI